MTHTKFVDFLETYGINKPEDFSKLSPYGRSDF